MPKFAANLTMLFNEVPFLDRFERAAKAGFTAVEFLFPYAFPAGDIKARLDANRLTLVLHNLPAGDWDAGERGIACLPGREAEFRAGVGEAIEYAKALGVPQLNCLAGKAPAGMAEAVLRKTFVANLTFAAAELNKAGLRLLIEPINTFDIPGFYLSRTAHALEILEEVASDGKTDNAFVQYDIYPLFKETVMAKIGFVGLGIMGSPMAAQLIKGGHELYLHSIPSVPADLVSAGGTACANGKEVAQKADVVIVMVPDTPHVQSALFDANGIAEGLSKGKTVVDMSSISPIATKGFAQKVNALGCDYLDAPVSGGEVGAKNATLSIMVDPRSDGRALGMR